MNVIQLDLKRGEFGFEVRDEGGHVLQTDTSLENGGLNFGFRPMQLVLGALGSCSAIDVASILKKQRQQVDSFSITIKGTREENKIPSLWKEVQVHFALTGKIDPAKAQRAISLSMDKHCSVAETLRRGGTRITWTVDIKETHHHRGVAL
ncbi:MAG: OsmC family protein [Bacteroidota bacterium]|nr:OsmC family protein [Bacteroidota bacterium]